MRRTRLAARAATVAAVAVVLAACTSSPSPEPSAPATSVASETSAAPRETTVEPGCEGMVDEARDLVAAERAPVLDPFVLAWMCEYVGDPLLLGDEPAPIDDLDAVRNLVDALEPADLSLPCTADYGPTLVLVLAGAEGTARLVMEDYGCRHMRVVGETGLLAGPPGMIAELRDLAGL